ncbi:adenylate/guanylate cyclase domain-containing protein [Aggregatimonas sangjinii]|uniref:Adenylate/guanylate cyclase domain-containing protein n=1 Tax=Aggregatimonas sangjinii TaxID=2583587 RepID=A0A5B7SU81_9FLAO|nr:adenylate/guanylate cyclase domain-containing protein [Aggregatimonas sangjinii]QCX00451.1 adenylate/guanylate cyclase domain-containing protein [Aggregatimonas sangjinii]
MRNISVRTRIMLMLLFVSLLACIVLGVLGSSYGEKVITEETISQLNLIRSSKEDQIKTYFKDVGHFVEVMGQNQTIVNAAKEFSTAYSKLSNDSLPKECSLSLNRYYDDFMDRLSRNLEIKKDPMLYLPYSVEGCYLQYEYIVNNKNPQGDKNLLTDPNDGSAYTEVHKKYHDYFELFIEKYNFYDVFLVNLNTGDIIYSVEKETDFATNLYAGPYRGSNLAQLARSLQINSDIQAATFQDFAPYRPSYGAPAAFAGIPLTEDGRTIAGLIVQIPIDEIDRIMTNDGNWEKDGLGKTGETFLVGDDEYMRSISRFFLEDSLNYRSSLLRMGETQKTIDKIYRYGSTTLQQRISSDNIKKALNGGEGYTTGKGYRGEEVLSTYEPLQIKGFNWAIIAEKDYDEFILPVKNFNKRMMILTIILILIITLLAMWMSRRFVRPLNKLSDAAGKIIAGDSSHRVEINSNDEFGELGASFNTMIEEVDSQKKALRDQSEFSSELLENFVPKEFAGRLKNGEKAFAQEYTNLTMILIDVAGFSDLLSELGADRSVKILSDIMEAFDTAAEQNHIERIRTIGDSYFAACGLFEPRLDHTNRSVVFAKETQQLIKQINITHNTNLDVQIALANGDVIAGIIGNENFSFDLWGPTVGAVFNLNNIDADGEIIVMDNVRERLVDLYDFEAMQETLSNGTTIYKLKDKK